MKEKLKEKLTLENILCIFIIACPILDMASFIFRNTFNIKFSPSTFIRPIIPIIVITIIFFKEKTKLKMLGVAFIYGIYAIIHLYLFNTLKTDSSYGGLANELQYITNYSFMILNLFIYIHVFKNKDTLKLKKSIFIAMIIYIISIFVAIITKTSSFTYEEVQIGYKGWFESGNSISAIFILGLFIVLNLIKEKKYKYWVIILTGLIGIYLTTLIGTRVGLFGFILVLFMYATAELLRAMFKKVQLNKNILIISLCAIVGIVIVVGIVGSSTLERRKNLQSMESTIIDTETSQESHITGDLLKLKNQIEEGKIQEDYMSKESQNAILKLYEYANNNNIKNTQNRVQQLVYNYYLVKEQGQPILMLFGNGYMANFYELILEMEIPAFLFNFGIIGFLLYFVPFLTIFIYCFYKGIKNIKNVSSEYIMLLAGLFCSFALAFLSGYTFFNSSTMMFIIVICTIILNLSNFEKDKE